MPRKKQDKPRRRHSEDSTLEAAVSTPFAPQQQQPASPSNETPAIPLHTGLKRECAEQDSPLDLSVKRYKTEQIVDEGPSSAAADDVTEAPLSSQAESKEESSETSALRYLEERFGGSSYLTDGAFTSGRQSAFGAGHAGGHLFASSLYGVATDTYAQPLAAAAAYAQLPAVPPTLKRTSLSPASRVSGGRNGGKHTAFSCACAKKFETLYDLTVHMRQSGHMGSGGRHDGPAVSATSSDDFPKLVRGQDIWLSNCRSQTSQILRCMTCNQSFPSLPELTMHMVKTKHFTTIVGESESSKKENVAAPTALKSSVGEEKRKSADRCDENNSIVCEICQGRIATGAFVDHVRNCLKQEAKRDVIAKRESVTSEAAAVSPLKKSPLSDPVVHSTTVSPSDGGDSGGALRAMENFIARSFKPAAASALSSNREEGQQEQMEPDSTELENKYIVAGPKDDEESSEGDSALSALQGLVYGGSEGSRDEPEHPLHSLQKLIHQTEPSKLLSNKNNTLILVNPIVTVMPNSNAPPALQINMESAHAHAAEESALDLRCRACSRNFATKGSYRYHMSRCSMRVKTDLVKHQAMTSSAEPAPLLAAAPSEVKQEPPAETGTKERKESSHTSRFSKYYALANEMMVKRELEPQKEEKVEG